MISRPGTSTSTSRIYLHFETSSMSFAWGKNVAPICWVIPPASPYWTLVLRILSNRVVLPVSTWPRIQHTGLLYFPYTSWKSDLSSFNSFYYFFLSFYFFYYYLFTSYSVFYFWGSFVSYALPSLTSYACYLSFLTCSNCILALFIFSYCFFVI